MKKLTILIILAAGLMLAACEKEEKTICKKTVTVYYDGVQQSQDVSKVISLKGSYKETEIEFDYLNKSTLTVTEVDCGCD